jgi:hypothetical protein
MSPKKEQSSKKYFLETDAGYNRLLKEAAKEIPSEETLIAIRDYNLRTGKLDRSHFASAIPETAAYYFSFIVNAEQKSDKDAAGELNVSAKDLKFLKTNLDRVTDKSLFEFCNDFVREHPQFTLRSLFTVMKRAIVLHSMTGSESALRKAARKKPQKK